MSTSGPGSRELPGPVAVTYEAGPTGFGLYRALTAAGIRCVVAAPSKLQRPPGIGSRPTPGTRCTWPGCCGWMRSPRCAVPTVEQEAARDLVRAREDCRGDLMRARHRLSKLLLRHGHRLLRRQGLDRRARRAGCAEQRFDSAGHPGWPSTSDYDDRADRDGPPRPARHGDRRRWPPTASSPPVVRRLCCLRGISTLTGFALAVEIGDWHRFTGNSIGCLSSAWCPAEHSSGAVPGARARSPRPATPTPAGCWSRPPGTTAPATAPGKTMRDRWELAPPAARARGDAGNRRLHQRWVRFNERRKKPRDRQRRHRPRTRRLVLVPGRPRD